MLKGNGSTKCLVQVIAVCLFLVIINSSNVLPEEMYRFERMWPTLQQPWYFSGVENLAVYDDYIYIMDALNYRVQKFTLNGQFVNKWGQKGTQEGYFGYSPGIAIDNSGNVYIADSENALVHKYSSNGGFYLRWGGQEGGGYPFENLCKIAVNDDGYIYILEDLQNRIQKFTVDGEFVLSWGGNGESPGEFRSPSNIALDQDGFVYVADTSNDRVQKFDKDGVFIKEWGKEGTGDVEFFRPRGIAIDKDGDVYICDIYFIRKFTRYGEFIDKWDSDSYVCYDVALDSENFLYASYGSYIKKISPEGKLIDKWASHISDDNILSSATSFSVSHDGYLYIADFKGHYFRKFSADGEYMDKWGGEGKSMGLFDSIRAVTASTQDYIYTVDAYNYTIQQFTSEGECVARWEHPDIYGETGWPIAISIDSKGNIYVLDNYYCNINKFNPNGVHIGTIVQLEHNNYPGDMIVSTDGFIFVYDSHSLIHKYSTQGDYILSWGSEGSEPGQFDDPSGMAIDSNNMIYISDAANGRIQKFDSDGQFVTAFGSRGSEPGMFNLPARIGVYGHKIYVSDSANGRMQLFKRTDLPNESKAIIVAGGGDYKGNSLWGATQMCANFTYRALAYQGFTKETIYYLTSDTDLDLDSNGKLDDVDGDALNENLEHAVTEWAGDAKNLVIYLTDHGILNNFVMSDKENLSVTKLGEWLDALQSETDCNEVILVYDACYSGSFLSPLTPPPAGKSRIIISSTQPEEEAQFITQGSISFSNYFWTHIFNGLDIRNAFDLSRTAISQSTEFQHPQLDANGNGVANEPEDFELTENHYIGNGTKIQGEAPSIESVSAEKLPDANSVRLTATGVTDNDGVARVWAVLRPPDYLPNPSTAAVLEFPSVDLLQTDNNAYEITHDGFNIVGTYRIAIYALDRIGNVCVPSVTSVTIENPLNRKAVIVAGGSQSEPLWSAIEKNANLSYEALKFQGYADEDIYFLSPVTFSSGVDGLPDASNVSYVVQDWAGQQSQDVLIYLIGEVREDNFQLNETESLSPGELDGYIDYLQDNIPGKVTVILDACQSGKYISQLTPPEKKERILISSVTGDQPAVFLQNGDICFSKFFWRYILNGANVRDAFTWAKSDIQYFGLFSNMNQTPVLDDDGDGVGNEKSEGKLARTHRIGVGIMLADVPPFVGDVSPEQVLNGNTSATIWAENVTAPNAIEEIWAVIIPPENNRKRSVESITSLDAVPLELAGENRYEATYSSFDRNGEYRIVIYAKDQNGEISTPKETMVRQNAAPDLFEDDDAFDTASIVVLNKPTLQRHNFHDAGDEDWVRFYGLQGQTYTASAVNLDANCDIVIEIYDSDGTTRIAMKDTSGDETADEFLPWPCLKDGVYYVKFRHYDETAFGENTGYECGVSLPLAPDRATITTDIRTPNGSPIGDAIIKNETNATAISEPDDGSMEIVLPIGLQILTIMTADGQSLETDPFLVEDATRSIPAIVVGEPPPAPLAISATDLQTNQFKARWNAAAEAAAYLFDASTDQNFDTFVGDFQNLSVSGTEHLVTGLTPDTLYYYRVRAVNAAGVSNNSNVVEAKTGILGDPNGDNAITIADVIVGLKTIANVTPSGIRDDYKKSGTDVNGDGQLGLEEVIYDLQKVAGLRP